MESGSLCICTFPVLYIVLIPHKIKVLNYAWYFIVLLNYYELSMTDALLFELQKVFFSQLNHRAFPLKAEDPISNPGNTCST